MMDNEYKYVVATRCMTYNQASYIEDALRGFAMQETLFPIVFIIVDDASTDGEQEVIKKWVSKNLKTTSDKDSSIWTEMSYGQRAVFSLKGSNTSTFVILLLNENYYQAGKHDVKMGYISEWFDDAKYQALCEGDDFWIDPLKLHKQVDFMENHQNCSMCFHNAVVIYDDIPKAPKLFNKINEHKEILLEDLIKEWIVPTASMLYKSSCLPFFPVNDRIVSGDLRMILHFASCGEVWALKDVMSFYRMTYHTASLTSVHRNDGAFLCYQRHHILECFDKSTNFKFHNIVGKYSKYWYYYSVFTQRKNKSIVWAVFSMPLFCIKKFFRMY